MSSLAIGYRQFPWDYPTAQTRKVPKPSTSNNLTQGLGIKSRNPETPTLHLTNFLLRLEKREDEASTKSVNAAISKGLTRMMSMALENLNRKSPYIFQHAKVHLVGSVADGTKLGIFDDFDFLIELPAVGRWLNTETNGDPACSPVIRVEDFMQMFYDELTAFTSGPSSHFLRRGYVKAVSSYLLHLQYFSENSTSDIDVLCDIVFCVPFDTEMEREIRPRARV